MEPHDLYRRSAEFAQSVLADIAPDTYGNDTPCEGWDVREAVNHLIGGQHYFAACAKGHGLESAGDPPDFSAGDLVEGHRAAAAACADAFTPEALGQTLPTFRGEVPGAVLFSIATMENVLHAWDAGRGAGLDPTVPDDIAQPVLDVVAMIAPGARGQGFDDEVAVPDDAPMTARIVAMAGRRP